jgi:hypothetical protein
MYLGFKWKEGVMNIPAAVVVLYLLRARVLGGYK